MSNLLARLALHYMDDSAIFLPNRISTAWSSKSLQKSWISDVPKIRGIRSEIKAEIDIQVGQRG